ncbi:LPO_1073/Vpar_1526 family protein [Streptomyces sp. NPDC048481]|uniref:LPO_1073/Vpar_1526 family protein n=1 Tax=Streptomyces sp. NPDC048481 TaxID=3365557 RepID=UPI0037210009
MKWSTKRQTSRDNNLNIQAGGDVRLGLGYREVKDISQDTAMEVFEKNFYRLSQGAYEVARERAEEFTRNLVESIQQRAPDALGQFQDPGTQSALYSAQSGYAKTGDSDLGEVLIELLIARISSDARGTSQLASSYAVTVAENLSSHHFAVLTCSFVLKQIAYTDVRSVDVLARNIEQTVAPFVDDLEGADPADLDYLTGLGCTILTASSLSAGECAGMNYPGLFTRGFSSGEVQDSVRLIGTPLVRPFGPDSDRFKINAITESELAELVGRTYLHDIGKIALGTLKNTVLQAGEIERMIMQSRPSLGVIFRRCAALGINGYINTAIGTAIAHANMRRVNPEFDLPLVMLVSKKPML